MSGNFLLRPINSTESTASVLLLEPQPGFVIKSKLDSCSPPTELAIGTKVFINVCFDNQVPKPNTDFNPSIVYPLIMNNQWEIPIITSNVRGDKDKKGAICYVWDCCINTECMSWVNKDYQLREILVEWCLESCELRQSVEISRDRIAFPKLKRKGDKIPTLEILNSDLNQDFRKEIDSIVEKDRTDPTSILEMQRDLVFGETLGERKNNGNEDTVTLPPLFPTTATTTTNNTTQKKPLIEEIQDLSIREKQAKTSKPRAIVEPKTLEYQATMVKTKDDKKFKLKIEITSELDSSLDYSIKYDVKNSVLAIKNINLHLYNEKKLEIPLPKIFEEQPDIKCFFIKSERKLIIFL